MWFERRDKNARSLGDKVEKLEKLEFLSVWYRISESCIHQATYFRKDFGYAACVLIAKDVSFHSQETPFLRGFSWRDTGQ